MPEIKRKQKETFEAMYRRFTRSIMLSGKTVQAKKIRFHERPLNDRARKEKALRRLKIENKRDYLKRIGKLRDEFPGVKAIMKLR